MTNQVCTTFCTTPDKAKSLKLSRLYQMQALRYSIGMNRLFSITAFYMLLLFILTGCSVTSETPTPAQTIPYSIHVGTISYPDDLYFPSRVTLTIELYGVSNNRGNDTLIVSQQIQNPQRFPVNYTLRYLSEETSVFQELYITYTLKRENETEPYMSSLIELDSPEKLDITQNTSLTRIQ